MNGPGTRQREKHGRKERDDTKEEAAPGGRGLGKFLLNCCGVAEFCDGRIEGFFSALAGLFLMIEFVAQMTFEFVQIVITERSAGGELAAPNDDGGIDIKHIFPP